MWHAILIIWAIIVLIGCLFGALKAYMENTWFKPWVDFVCILLICGVWITLVIIIVCRVIELWG